MSAVQLNQPLALEKPEYLPDTAGGFQEAWTVIGQLWGTVKSSSGREVLQDGASVSTVTHSVIVRAAPLGAPQRPTARQRFRLGTRIFRILAVLEKDTSGRFLTCRVVEERTA